MPKHTRIGDNIIEIGKRFRVEPGPRRRRAIATPEILSDNRTAPNYRLGEPDAAGQMIRMGEPMVFLEHGAAQYEREIWFYLYEVDHTEDEPRWTEIGCYPDEAAALARADELATG